ncbi:MAG: dihydroorotase [Candidatus Kerfeldbacteria bacterium]|nr:dihydroorotase [Candidatus Kerfeldbacteria bacterium]
MEKLRIRRPDDWHVHLRRGEVLRAVLPYTTQQFARALVMPNTDPPILTADDVQRYRREIAAPPGFLPLMTVKLTAQTTPTSISHAFEHGAIAAKLYPVGVTTNAEDGVVDEHDLYPVFAAMEQIGMVLCIHGERPNTYCLDRETAYLDVVSWLARTFPRLKIVLEHITCRDTVAFIQNASESVAATITVHHLVLTLDDVVGDRLRPHHFCNPMPKSPADRSALIHAATSGSPKFFLGTDSAPHTREQKEYAAGAAGIFTAPVAMPLLATIFEEEGRLQWLAPFTSEFGADFYGLPKNEGQLELVREPWTVPETLAGIVPFKAGELLSWRVDT